MTAHDNKISANEAPQSLAPNFNDSWNAENKLWTALQFNATWLSTELNQVQQAGLKSLTFAES